MIDTELKQLAALALRNAFWRDFSALVNAYLEAAEGLDIATQEAQMGDMTSIYGRDENAEGDVFLNIWTPNGEAVSHTTEHETILEALEHETATAVYLRGQKVFERRDGEWYYVE
mgnify:CR=1 FL=1